MSLRAEIAGYFLCILAGATIAACAARSRDRTAGIIAGFFAMLPIFLANFLNLLWTAFSDPFEWRALASAVALNIVAISAVCAGSAIALLLRKYKLPHRAPNSPRNSDARS